jgi:hypothetical protein
MPAADGNVTLQPTNFSFALPAHFVRSGLANFKTNPGAQSAKDVPTIDQIVERTEKVNSFTGEKVGGVKLPWHT